jgi:hypothetical protein
VVFTAGAAVAQALQDCISESILANRKIRYLHRFLKPKEVNLEKVNGATEVEQGQEVVARKPWHTPVVEELPVNQAEASLNGRSSNPSNYR